MRRGKRSITKRKEEKASRRKREEEMASIIKPENAERGPGSFTRMGCWVEMSLFAHDVSKKTDREFD